MRSTVHTAPFSGVSSRISAKHPSAIRHAVSASRSVWRIEPVTLVASASGEPGAPEPSTTSTRATATGRRWRRAEAIRASSATRKYASLKRFVSGSARSRVSVGLGVVDRWPSGASVSLSFRSNEPAAGWSAM